MRTGRASGLTLVEVTVASAIMILLILTVFSMLKSATDNTSSSAIDAHLAGRGRDAIELVILDLRSATQTSLQLSSSSSLTFRKNEGFKDGKIVLGNPITYGLQTGRLVKIQGGVTVKICPDVKNLNFTVQGRIVTMALDLEAKDLTSRVRSVSQQATVELRN